MEIFVNELPKSCKQCPYYEINSYADILGYKTTSHKCVLKGSMITGDCPLKSLSDRLAEERKKVVQEIRERLTKYTLTNDDFLFDTYYKAVDVEKVLDQIERGE